MTRWLDTLRGALPGGAQGIAELERHLRRMPRAEAHHAVADWLMAWIDDAVLPGDWEALTGAPAAVAPREMGVLWEALARAGLAPERLVRGGGGTAWVERWAWSPRWYLSDQDEDLFLFDHAQRLLETAADPECPKRALLIEIAAHAVRDRAHAFALSPPRHPDEADPFALAARLAPLARAAGAPPIAEYFDRLASYAHPGAVDRAAAVQRARDLHRCSAPSPDEVDVRLEGAAWRVVYPRAYPRGASFTIVRKTGAIVPPPKSSRRK